MYYNGLVPKYKVNRPLSKTERESRLSQDKSLGLEPTSALSVIKMNSTFMELSDKYYPWKGVLTLLMIFGLGLAFFVVLFPGYIIFVEQWGEKSADQRMNDSVIAIFLILLGGMTAIFSFWGLKKESFRYTHYPIRLNRKNRKVYVFRLDGTVLEANWDDIFITIVPSSPSERDPVGDGWDLRANILAGDRETVLETFAFGYVSEPENLRHHFEYLRLYMEKGPAAIAPYTLDCLDIADRKETAWFGFKRLILNFHGSLVIQLIMLMPLIPSAIGRSIAMATSKIPRWPVEVEAACPIEKGDPWVRDASTHPAK
ncbi:MAG: hypothetical protein LAT61_00710 [Alcanivorax sp.]|nr:hypothetical protein [Alcanivorax sp.]